MTAPGQFLSFEGIDGSGKSTQARLLAETLRKHGHAVTLTREPGGSPGAEEIRALVLEGGPDRWSPETELLLFTAARRDHLEKTIRPALDRGEVVITDRFADSTRVYQGTSRGDLRALVDTLHDAMIGVEPDVTLLIDMDPERALGRSLARLAGGRRAVMGRALRMAPSGVVASASAVATDAAGPEPEDRFERFGPDFQSRLRAAFLALATDSPRFIVIDGDRDPDSVAAEIAAHIRARIGT